MEEEKLIKRNVLIWLDDYRNPYLLNDNWVKHWAPQWVGKLQDVVWVKSYVELVKWIEDNGLPTQIAFDHDLADEHYVQPHVYQKEKYDDWEKNQEFKEKTGLDAAKWLVDYCIDNKKELPMWVVQSANPNGAKNINSYLTQFLQVNKHFMNMTLVERMNSENPNLTKEEEMAVAIADDLNSRRGLGIYELDEDTQEEILKGWVKIINDITGV